MDSSVYGRIGDALSRLIITMGIVLIVSVPLAIWKAIEIGMWIYKHLSVTFK